MGAIVKALSEDGLRVFIAAGKAIDWDATPQDNGAMFERDFSWTPATRRRWDTPFGLPVFVGTGPVLLSISAKHTRWSDDTTWDDAEVAARRADLVDIIDRVTGVESRMQRDRDGRVHPRWVLPTGTSLWLREDDLDLVGPLNTQADDRRIGG